MNTNLSVEILVGHLLYIFKEINHLILNRFQGLNRSVTLNLSNNTWYIFNFGLINNNIKNILIQVQQN